MSSALYGAGVRLHFAQQDSQQGALADTVVADDADPLAAHDAQRELSKQYLAAVTVGYVTYFNDFLAG